MVGKDQYRLVAALSGLEAEVHLDVEQQRVVAHECGPMLVLGGPGTGKTTTLIESVVARIAAGVAPESVLLLTFSRRTAKEMRRRISARLGRTTTAPQAMTFHSLCLAIVRNYALPGFEDRAGVEPLRLLTAPEQDYRVREALLGAGPDLWPAQFKEASGTRGFAQEVRAVLARARQLAMDPEDLISVGRHAKRPEWTAAGRFFEDYLRTLDFENAIDYAELVHRCRLILAKADHNHRPHYSHIYVDEYQETDPAQIGLLRLLVGNQGTVVAAGDPDQSIYRFRGSESRNMGAFGTDFGGEHQPIATVTLRTSYRFGAHLARIASAVSQRIPIPGGISAADFAAARQLQTGDLPGQAECFLYDSESAQNDWVAASIRRLHLNDKIPLASIAILVRSGRRAIPGLTRALIAAGVAIDISRDDIGLSTQPAIRPLHLALTVVSQDRPIDVQQARQLLLSPLCGVDALGIRRLGRTLRALDARRGDLPRPSGQLIAEALHNPAILDGAPASAEIVRCRELAQLLADARRAAHTGTPAQEVLWQIWQATSWPARLTQQALGSGDASLRANRDLDALCALFELADRKETAQNSGIKDLLAEIDNHHIPAEVYRDSDVGETGVRLMTAHRGKGEQWDVVFVVGAQEGVWPDLRRRGTLLEPDRLLPSGVCEPEPISALLADERRLFYVACTRARCRLIVTAVKDAESGSDQPSRFLAELGLTPTKVSGKPTRILTLTGLVAQLRRTIMTPETSPALRAAAVQRLAQLAVSVDDQGHRLVPSADPHTWWGIREPSQAQFLVHEAEEPVRLSGSSLAALLNCPRQWFLERQAHAGHPGSAATTIGELIHALADHAQDQDWTAAELGEYIDAVWEHIPYGVPWFSDAERAEAHAAVDRFLMWRQANPRSLVGTEVPFMIEVPVGKDRVVLAGKVDRLEQTADGKLHIVDLKAGRGAVPTVKDVATMEQLGVYQVAAAAGAFDIVTTSGAVGGAETVYVRKPATNQRFPTVRQQASIQDDPGGGQELSPEHATWVHVRLSEAAAIVREGHFPAVACQACSYCAFASSCPAHEQGKQVIR